MTITPIYPRRTKENIIPGLARDLAEIIKRGLDSGRFVTINGTIVLGGKNMEQEIRNAIKKLPGIMDVTDKPFLGTVPVKPDLFFIGVSFWSEMRSKGGIVELSVPKEMIEGLDTEQAIEIVKVQVLALIKRQEES